MKQINISKDINFLSEFKSKAAKILLTIQTSHRPLVITQNGKAAAVLISPSDFDHLTEQARFMEAVQKALTMFNMDGSYWPMSYKTLLARNRQRGFTCDQTS